MDSLSEYTQMTNYTVICGKKCNLFKNLAKGAKLHNFEQCLCNIVYHSS